MSISAALITLNEARNLTELLPRLAWVDEVVVVDGGSEDGTADIARGHGCRVVVHPFDTFAAQRNRAIDLAREEWVLSIDADERPTDALIAEVPYRIAGLHEAFRVPIKSRIFGRPFRHSGTQDDRPIRLFRRARARWVGDVHEVLAIDGLIGILHGPLEHDTLADLPTFLRKMHRYTTLEASHRVAAGRPPRVRDRWLAPPLEVARRLIYKGGILDGTAGVAFGLLSGLSKWVEADKHRKLWRDAA